MPQLSEYIKKVISEKYPSLQMDELPFEDFLSIIVPFLDGKIIENWDGFYAHISGNEIVAPVQSTPRNIQQAPPVVVNVPFSSQSTFIGSTSEEEIPSEKPSIFSPILKLFGKSAKPESTQTPQPKPQQKPPQYTPATFSALVNDDEKPVTSFSTLVTPETTPAPPVFSSRVEEKPSPSFSTFIPPVEEKPAPSFSAFIPPVEEKPSPSFSAFIPPVEEKPAPSFSTFIPPVEEKPAPSFSAFIPPVEEKPASSFSAFIPPVEEKPVPEAPLAVFSPIIPTEPEPEPITFAVEQPMEEEPITLDSLANEMEQNLNGGSPKFSPLMQLPEEKPTETTSETIENMFVNFNQTIPLEKEIEPKKERAERPSDTSNPDWKPDTDKGFLGSGEKYMAFASRRGLSQAVAGNPRKNDYSHRYLSNNQWHIISLATGSETVPYSSKGSQLAVNTTIETLSQHIPDTLDTAIQDYVQNGGTKKSVGDLLYNTFGMTAYNAYKSIEDEAGEKNTMVNNFATSLTMVIAKKYDFGWFVATLWIGNGNLVIFDAPSGQIAFLREKGFDLATKIPYITMPEIMEQNELYQRIYFTVIEDFTAIIALSDGVSNPKFGITETQLSNPESWKNLWKDLQNQVDFSRNDGEVGSQLLKWLNFNSENANHDRTIGLLY